MGSTLQRRSGRCVDLDLADEDDDDEDGVDLYFSDEDDDALIMMQNTVMAMEMSSEVMT